MKILEVLPSNSAGPSIHQRKPPPTSAKPDCPSPPHAGLSLVRRKCAVLQCRTCFLAENHDDRILFPDHAQFMFGSKSRFTTVMPMANRMRFALAPHDGADPWATAARSRRETRLCASLRCGSGLYTHRGGYHGRDAFAVGHASLRFAVPNAATSGSAFRSVRANELRMFRPQRHSIRPPFSRTVRNAGSRDHGDHCCVGPKGATTDKGEMVVEELRKSGYLVIDDKGSVSYKP